MPYRDIFHVSLISRLRKRSSGSGLPSGTRCIVRNTSPASSSFIFADSSTRKSCVHLIPSVDPTRDYKWHALHHRVFYVRLTDAAVADGMVAVAESDTRCNDEMQNATEFVVNEALLLYQREIKYFILSRRNRNILVPLLIAKLFSKSIQIFIV